MLFFRIQATACWPLSTWSSLPRRGPSTGARAGTRRPVFQEGDYFGRTVNVAARIADYARPGEVLVSQEVVEAALGSPLSFDEIGPVTLKGVIGEPRLHTAHRLA